jgi:DNA-binding NtrC family response regulator
MTQPPAPRAPSVLVVEHSPAIRRLFDVILRGVAGQLFTAEDPAAARLVLENEPIDVVVLEPQGANEFSWNLLDELVAAGIPTVVVTSRVDEDVLDEAARRHAAAILTKPFRSTELAAAINRL